MKKLIKILKGIARGERGFTLIELLAVMAIVAVLAGIVSTSVSGSGDTSVTTAAQQDATTVNSSAADFFGDQEGAALITPHSVTVEAPIIEVVGSAEVPDSPTSVQQKKNSRWPEQYITDDGTGAATSVYTAEFPTSDPVNGTDGDVVKITIRAKDTDTTDEIDGEIIDRTTFLQEYTAIDFDKLESLSFVEARPDTASTTTVGDLHNFLWLFRKSTAAGGSGDDDSRTISVFKLTTVRVIESGVAGVSDAGDLELNYEQIF